SFFTPRGVYIRRVPPERQPITSVNESGDRQGDVALTLDSGRGLGVEDVVCGRRNSGRNGEAGEQDGERQQDETAGIGHGGGPRSGFDPGCAPAATFRSWSGQDDLTKISGSVGHARCSL